jgi:hypothetical protein
MIVGLGAECGSKLRFRLLRAILAAVAVLVAGLGRAQAEDAVLVPCDTLHLKVAGTGAAECRSSRVHAEESDFLIEKIQAPLAGGIIGVTRIHGASNRSVAFDTPVREVAEKLSGFERIENWSPERPIAGYTIGTFRGIAAGGQVQVQCVAFARHEFQVAGAYREQVIGLYCTQTPAPIDDATAQALLQGITVE